MIRSPPLLLITVCYYSSLPAVSAFQNLLPNISFPSPKPKATYGAIELEDQLLAAIESNDKDNRLDNSDAISSLVSQLENSSKSIPQPAIAPQLVGGDYCKLQMLILLRLYRGKL